MTLLTYEIFETVVREKSFQKASEVLHMTPSAVSHAIAAMEKEIGVTLFVRGKQETVLTAYGNLFLPYVRDVLKSNENLHQTVAQFQGLEKGTIKIGGFNSVCTVWLPGVVKKFHGIFPNINIEIYQGTYEDVTEWLRNGTVDIALLSKVSAAGFDYVPLYRDRIMCVVPKGFRTENGGYMTFAEMKEQRFVTQWQSCDGDIRNVLKTHDIELKTYCHVIDDMSTVAMVEGGLGICMLPELLRRVIGERVDWYPLEEEQYREIGYGVVNMKNISPAVRKMIEVIENFVQMEYT